MVSDACAGGSQVCNMQEDDIENESESFDEESIQLLHNEERDSSIEKKKRVKIKTLLKKSLGRREYHLAVRIMLKRRILANLERRKPETKKMPTFILQQSCC